MRCFNHDTDKAGELGLQRQTIKRSFWMCCSSGGPGVPRWDRSFPPEIYVWLKPDRTSPGLPEPSQLGKESQSREPQCQAALGQREAEWAAPPGPQRREALLTCSFTPALNHPSLLAECVISLLPSSACVTSPSSSGFPGRSGTLRP